MKRCFSASFMLILGAVAPMSANSEVIKNDRGLFASWQEIEKISFEVIRSVVEGPSESVGGHFTISEDFYRASAGNNKPFVWVTGVVECGENTRSELYCRLCDVRFANDAEIGVFADLSLIDVKPTFSDKGTIEEWGVDSVEMQTVYPAAGATAAIAKLKREAVQWCSDRGTTRLVTYRSDEPEEIDR